MLIYAHYYQTQAYVFFIVSVLLKLLISPCNPKCRKLLFQTIHRKMECHYSDKEQGARESETASIHHLGLRVGREEAGLLLLILYLLMSLERMICKLGSIQPTKRKVGAVFSEIEIIV